MKHVKYPSIENSYREKTINVIRESGYAAKDVLWCVQEKIHGANVQIQTDGENVVFGSRRMLLDSPEAIQNFYSLSNLVDELSEKVKVLYSAFSPPEGATIVVFGELFGGKYPHPDVPSSDDRTVQQGVYYHPNNKFIAFDIMIVNGENREFVSALNAYGVLKLCGFDALNYFMVGTFDECLEYPNSEQTVVPDYYGLPQLEDNIMEGVILRPVNPVFFANGSRVILKNKNERFSEKQKTPRKPKEPVKLSDEAKSVLENILQYVNENRFDSVLAKRGGVFERKEIGAVIGEFMKDVMDDFNKDYNGEMDAINKNERKVVNKEVADAVRKIVLSKV